MNDETRTGGEVAGETPGETKKGMEELLSFLKKKLDEEELRRIHPDTVSFVTGMDEVTGEWTWRTVRRRKKGFHLLDFVVLHYSRPENRWGQNESDGWVPREFRIPDKALLQSVRRLYEGGLLVSVGDSSHKAVREWNGEIFRAYDDGMYLPTPARLEDGRVMKSIIDSIREYYEVPL
jgi:hypothetical protein